MQFNKQELEVDMEKKKEVDMEQQIGCKLGKEYIRLYIVTLLIKLIYRIHHAKCQAG